MMARSLTESLLKDLLIQLKEKKGSSDGPRLIFADFLKDNNISPDIKNINFSIEGISRLVQEQGNSNLPDVVWGTDLFERIDFTGCTFEGCDFSYCNLSHCIFKNKTLEKCILYQTVFNNCVMDEVTFNNCLMIKSSFDFSKLSNIHYVNCKLEDATFAFLVAMDSVCLINCSLGNNSFLGTLAVTDSRIQYDGPTTCSNVYLFDAPLQLVGATINNLAPPVLLTWDTVQPGRLAALVYHAMRHCHLTPILCQYRPDVSLENTGMSPDLLTSEVLAINQFFKLINAREKINPLEIIAHAHENPEQYPEINKMYRYAKRALSAVGGILIPGGSDINPLFYGQERHELTVPGDMRRDVLEFMLIYLQRRSNMPLFAVCRGSQAVGLSYGADFVPHIPGRRPLAENFHIENDEDNSESIKPSYSLAKVLSSAVGEKIYFQHHQYFQLKVMPRSLFTVLSTNQAPSMSMTVMAENLQQNIFITQFHPEVAWRSASKKELGLSQGVAEKFLQGFSERVKAYQLNKKFHSQLALPSVASLKLTGFIFSSEKDKEEPPASSVAASIVNKNNKRF